MRERERERYRYAQRCHVCHHKSRVELFMRAKITRRERSRDIGRVTGLIVGNNIASRGRRNIGQQRRLGGRAPQLCPRPSLRIRFCTPPRWVCMCARGKFYRYIRTRARTERIRSECTRRLSFSGTHASSSHLIFYQSRVSPFSSLSSPLPTLFPRQYRPPCSVRSPTIFLHVSHSLTLSVCTRGIYLYLGPLVFSTCCTAVQQA